MLVDKTSHPALGTFPWESVYEGLARAEKTVATFNVGPIQKYGLENVRYNMLPTNKRWYLAVKHGYPLEGFNVNVTEAITLPVAWFQCGDSKFWRPAANAKFFGPLLDWIEKSRLFTSTGRIVFFLNTPGLASPPHVDYVHNGVDLPKGVRQSEFLWLTPPDNPKQLYVDGQLAPWACSFDPMIEHWTTASDKTQWSLRIDGVLA